MRRHAEAIRAQDRFAVVATATLENASEALRQLTGLSVRVVPFFVEDGYFTRVAIPRLVGPDAILCPPVGVHDGMAALIERQALSAGAGRDTAVLVAGHGSASAPGRALALHRHTARVAATGLFAHVVAAHLEEDPFIAQTLATMRRHDVVVIGYFAGEGGHVRDDMPALVQAEAEARGGGGPAVRFHGFVADDQAMAEIILDQADVTGRN
jgi:sirohydrochlorin cobaltochelatase